MATSPAPDRLAALVARFANRDEAMAAVNAEKDGITADEFVAVVREMPDARVRLNESGGVCIPLGPDGLAVINVPLASLPYVRRMLDSDVAKFIARPAVIQESARRAAEKAASKGKKK